MRKHISLVYAVLLCIGIGTGMVLMRFATQAGNEVEKRHLQEQVNEYRKRCIEWNRYVYVLKHEETDYGP